MLQLVAVGNSSVTVLKALEEPLFSHLGVISAQSKSHLPAPGYAFNKDRNQYHCNAILRRLVPLASGQDFVLGVTDVDLFVPDSPFIFGEADRESKVAVISLFRLHQGADAETLKRRARVEAVHQAGRLIGLSNCEDPRCAMFVATSVAECDRKGAGLCNACRNELAKILR